LQDKYLEKVNPGWNYLPKLKKYQKLYEDLNLWFPAFLKADKRLADEKRARNQEKEEKKEIEAGWPSYSPTNKMEWNPLHARDPFVSHGTSSGNETGDNISSPTGGYADFSGESVGYVDQLLSSGALMEPLDEAEEKCQGIKFTLDQAEDSANQFAFTISNDVEPVVNNLSMSAGNASESIKD